MEHQCLGAECTTVLMIPCLSQQALLRDRDELSAECNQWQKKVAELWAKQERFRTALREALAVLDRP